MQKKAKEWAKYFKDLEAWLRYKYDKRNNGELVSAFPVEIRVVVYGTNSMKYDTGWMYLPFDNTVSVRHCLSTNLIDLMVKVIISCNGNTYEAHGDVSFFIQKSVDEIYVKMASLPSVLIGDKEWNKMKAPKAMKSKWKNLEKLMKTSARNSSKLRNLLMLR